MLLLLLAWTRISFPSVRHFAIFLLTQHLKLFCKHYSLICLDEKKNSPCDVEAENEDTFFLGSLVISVWVLSMGRPGGGSRLLRVQAICLISCLNLLKCAILTKGRAGRNSIACQGGAVLTSLSFRCQYETTGSLACWKRCIIHRKPIHLSF